MKLIKNYKIIYILKIYVYICVCVCVCIFSQMQAIVVPTVDVALMTLYSTLSACTDVDSVACSTTCRPGNNTYSDGIIWPCTLWLSPHRPTTVVLLPTEFAVSRGSVCTEPSVCCTPPPSSPAGSGW